MKIVLATAEIAALAATLTAIIFSEIDYAAVYALLAICFAIIGGNHDR